MNKTSLLYNVNNTDYFVYNKKPVQGAAKMIEAQFDYGNIPTAKELKKAYDNRGKDVRANLLSGIINVPGVDSIEFVYDNKLSTGITGLLNEAIAKNDIKKAVELKTAYDNRKTNLVDFLTDGLDGSMPYVGNDGRSYTVKHGIKTFVYNDDIQTAKKVQELAIKTVKRDYENKTDAIIKLTKDVDNNTPYISSKDQKEHTNAAKSIESYLKMGKLGAAKRIYNDYEKAAKNRSNANHSELVALLKTSGFNKRTNAAGASVNISEDDMINFVYANRCNIKDESACPYAKSMKTLKAKTTGKLSAQEVDNAITAALKDAETIPCDCYREAVKEVLADMKTHSAFMTYNSEDEFVFGLGDYSIGKMDTAAPAGATAAQKTAIANLTGKAKCQAKYVRNGETHYIQGVIGEESTTPAANMSALMATSPITTKTKGSLKKAAEAKSVVSEVRNYLTNNAAVKSLTDLIARLSS